MASKSSTYFSTATVLTTLVKPGGAPVTYDNAVVNKVPDPGPPQVPQAPPPQLTAQNSDNLPPPGGGQLLIAPFKGGAIFTPPHRGFNTSAQDTVGKTIKHGGLDLMPANGDPKLYAVCTGQVVAYGITYSNPELNPLGYYVVIQNSTPINGKIYQFYYLHMAGPPKIGGKTVGPGNLTVTIGDYIGEYDNTGYSFGAHLHMNVQDWTAPVVDFGAFGAYHYVDPEPIFASQGVYFT